MTTATATLEDPRPRGDALLDRLEHRAEPPYWTARSRRGMIATAHYRATEAGARMFELGGNAFDAAIAASLALGVSEPAGSGLGGMAVVVAHDSSRRSTFAVNGACRAPARATPEAVSNQRKRYRGYGAVAVPAYPAVLDHLVRRYASLHLAKLADPAIRLARDGFVVTPTLSVLTKTYARPIREGSASRIFLSDGKPLAIGRTVRQPELAATLERLSTAGLRDFYDGEVAAAIVRDMEENGGFVSRADLLEMNAVESATVQVPFFGGRLHTPGPPAGGIALAQLVNLFGASGLEPDLDDPDVLCALARIIGRVRSDRRRYRLKVGADDLGAAAELVSAGYAQRTAAELFSARQGNDGPAPNDPGTGETSHISAMDPAGNAVAITQSIERSFGSAEIGRDLGFLYNGFLRAFKVEARRHPHYLRPGVPARSNAAPVLVLEDGVPVVAAGSTGSERATSGTFETLLRLKSRSPFEAVRAPRLHCTPENEVLLEAERFPKACLSRLRERGFRLRELDGYSFTAGALQLVVREGSDLVGVGDPRRDGWAAPDDG